MRAAAAHLWASLPMLAVAVYCALSVTPGFASKSFPEYTARWAWVVWAVAATAACTAATARIECRRCRLSAAALAATYILARAVYTRVEFPMLAPWSSFAQSIALSVCITWSWGRPPIVQRRIAEFPEPRVDSP